MKPQIGVVILLYLLARLPWKNWIGVIVTGAVLGLAAIVPIARQPWLSTWIENMRATLAPGGIAALSGEKAVRVTLTQLQYPVSVLTGSTAVASAVAWILGIGLLGLVVIAMRKKRFDTSDLLPVSAIAVISFIPVYHRNYDLVILVLPLAWAIGSMCSAKTRAWVTIALIVALISVNPVNVERWAAAHTSEGFQNGLFWRAIGSRYLNWGTAVLGVWLTYCVLASNEALAEDRAR